MLTLAALAAAQSPQLEVLQTVDGGDLAMLYRPEAIAFGPDGTSYVLNAGDGQVIQFDADWQQVRTFGHEGEGPGEFLNPTGMIIRDGRLWVFEMLRATVFSLAGEYERTLTGRLEMHEPISTDRGILVRLGSSDRLAALLDDQLELLTKLGPECPTGDFMASYQACGFVHVLPHPDFLALLLNPFDGHLWALDRDGAVARDLDLVGASGQSRVSKPDDGGNVSMRFTLVIATGGVDRAGRFWTLPMVTGEDDPDAPQVIVVRDRRLAPIAEFTLPDDVHAFRIDQAPDGHLILLDGGASLLHVCAYPAELGDD
ncbi:MAG: hypothetical protein R3D98_13380 [Candidatus Krumholzibacteriia bacterium]